MNLGKRVRQALLYQGIRKEDYTLELCGCTIPELRKHIEDQFTEEMIWENYSYEGWHLDHIRPCASFDLSDINQQKVCFNWRNLQPMWALENTVKQDRYSKENESAWVKRMKDLGYEGELFLKYQTYP